MGVLKIVFIILIVLLPFNEIFRLEYGNGLAIKLFDIMVGVLGISWILQNLKDLSSVYKNAIGKYIIMFCGIASVSLLVNFPRFSEEQILIGLLYLVRFVFYALIFFIVKSFPESFRKKILILLCVAGVVIAFIGFIQYIYYSNLQNLYYLGWDHHMYRLFTVFFDPNYAGAFLVLVFTLIGTILLQKKLMLKKKNAFLTISVAIIIVALYLTFSRSAFIMFFASFLTFCFLEKKMRFFLFILIIALITFIFSSKNFYIENLNLLRTASTYARVESMRNAMLIISENPLLGVGFNTYRYIQVHMGYRNIKGADKSHADAGTDNSFLFVFATTGIVGFIVYIRMWSVILMRSYRAYKKKHQIIGLIVFCSSIGLLVNALFINSLFYTSIMLWIWTIIGVMESS